MTHRQGWLSVALIAFAVAVACGYPEQRTLDQYFNALNAKDNDTLSSFAAVSLDTQGKRVDKWRINQASAEQRQPAPMIDLRQKSTDAEAAVAQNKKAYTDYYLDHPNEVGQVQDALRKNAAIPAKLQPYAAKWKEFTEKERDLKRAAADAKDQVEREKRMVGLSVGVTEGIEALTGDMLSRVFDVTLTIGGAPRDYRITVRKYEVANPKGGRTLSHWMIYSIEPKA